MEITVNGQQVLVEEGGTVLTLVARHTSRELDDAGTPLDGRPLAVAVAIGGTVLRRADWAGTQLREGDAVDVVTAVQGG